MATDSRPVALVLAPEAPYPVLGGGALRTASLVEHLARTHDVDLIVFRQPGAPDPRDRVPAGVARQTTVIDLPPNGRGLAARVMRNTLRLACSAPPLVDRFAGFGAAVERAVAGRHYDLGLIEHFWCAPYWDRVAPVCARTVLDLHNIESVLHARCARVEGVARGLAHRVFQRAALEMEREWLPRFDDVLTTSEADGALARAIAPGARVSVYPNAIPRTPLPERREDDAIVFSGNMEYHPNISAVRYFRRDVWPLLRERWPSLVWRLVGRNAWAVRAYTAGDARIDVRGEVDDAVIELARAKVAIVPLVAGSGTRLKILEAWAAGTAVVSTSLGAEGLGARDGEHLLVADGAAAFAEAVSRLLACKELRDSLGAGGRLLMENEFTWDAAWKKLRF